MSDVLEIIDVDLMKPFKYPRLAYKEYLYHFHKPCSHHLRWKCNRVYALKCPAVLRTNMDLVELKLLGIDHDHNHAIDDVAIIDIKMQLEMYKASSFFRNDTTFKSRNPYANIRNVRKVRSKNSTRFKRKNGYANINIDEEDIPENIKNNKLAKFCSSINQICFVDPLDYDYEDRYTDGLEQKIKNIRITRNTRKQKQIESNNSKNDTTKNNIRCSSFNDKIKTFNRVYDELLPKEQNLIFSKNEGNDGKVNESTLLPNTDTEKNTLTINTKNKKKKKIIITYTVKKSLISNIVLNKDTLTSNTYEEINTLTTNTHTPKEKKSLISNINNDKTTLTSNLNKDKNILANDTHEEINTLTTNTHIPNEKITLISNINNDKTTLTSNLNKDKNNLAYNTHEEINTLTTNTHIPNEKIALISNINNDKTTLTSNLNKDKNILANSTHEEINTLTTNTHTHKEKKLLISNIKKDKNNLISNRNKDRNTVTSNTYEEINTLTTNTHIPPKKIALISNINNDKTTLTSNLNKDKNILVNNTHEEINTLTSNTHIPNEKIALISNINNDKTTLTSNLNEDKNILDSNTHEELNTLTNNTHIPNEKIALISNINNDETTLTSNLNEDKNILDSNTHEEINNLTTNTHIPNEKIALISNINNDKNNMISNRNKDRNTVTSNTHEEINTLTTNTHIPNERIALISNINNDKNNLISNRNKDRNTVTSNLHEEINTSTTNTHIPNEKIELIIDINNDKTTLTSNLNEDKNILASNTHEKINSLTSNTYIPNEKIALISNINNDKTTLTSNLNEDKNILDSNTHEEINTLTNNTHIPNEKIAVISNINNDKNNMISNLNEDKNILACNTHEEINTLTNNTHTPKEKKSLISNIKKDKNNLISNRNKDRNTVTSNLHKEINTPTTNIHTPGEKIALISNINKDKNTLTCNTNNDKSTLISNPHEEINTLIIYAHTREEKNSLICNIDKDRNTETSNTHEEINTLTINNYTPKEKNSFISSINKDTNKKKNSLIRNLKKKENAFAYNMVKDKITSIDNISKNKSVTTTYKKIKIRTTNKQKTESSLIINVRQKKISSKLKKNTRKPRNQNVLEMKTTPSIFTSIIQIKPSIKSSMNKAINNEDDITINSDRNSYYDNYEEPNHITNDVNLVHDDMISIYCKENWPTILNKLSDPLTGIEVYESIIFNKAYSLLLNQYNKTKLKIQKLKSHKLQWKLKFECLEFQIKKLVESTRSHRNTNHVSIQNQNQKDTTLCKNIEVGKKETNAGIKKKDLKNNITPENFKTSNSYQKSLNSGNRNLTESDTDIKTTKSKKFKTNISSTQVMADLIKYIPSSTTVSILIPESLKSKKRNLTECDTYITRSKAKIMKTYHSSIPNFDYLDAHIPPETTVSRINPEPFYSKQNNLIQSDSGIEMTKSKVIESNEYPPLVSSDVYPNISILTEYGTEIEFSEITESNMIDYYEPSTSATKSKTMESTPVYMDITVDSPPNITASSVNSNMLNGQSSSTLHNTQIECYEPSTSTSFDLTENNLPIIMNSRLNNKYNIFTQYHNDIEITPFTSESTDLSSNIPTFLNSSVKATSPLNSDHDLCMNDDDDDQSNVKKYTCFDVFVVGKDAQLSTLNSTRIKRIDWRSPNALLVASKQIPVVPLNQNAILPVALKRINMDPPSQYPFLNMLLTKPNNTVIKLEEENTTPFNNHINAPLPQTNTNIELDERNILNSPVNIQMKAPFPPANKIIKQDKRSFILNIPANSVNNKMKALLPDVVYESTQITNKIREDDHYQNTILSNYSHNLHKAPHQMKPVPIAIPLPPSEIIYDYSDEV